MNRMDFLKEIFNFCGKDDEQLMRTYDLALTTNKPIDWNKLYKIFITESKNRYLPAPSYFIGLFDRCLIAEQMGGKYDDIRLRVNLKHAKLENGYPYEFVTYNNNSTVYELKQSARRKWGDKLVSFQVYNEDTLKWETI